MQSTIPFLLSLSAMVCWGILYFLNAKLSRSIGPLVTLFLFELLGIPLLLIIAPFFLESVTMRGILTLTSLGIFDTFIWLIFLYATTIGFLPLVTVLGDIYIVITTALGVLLLHESFSIYKGLSVFMVLFGAIFLSVNLRLFLKTRKNMLFNGALPALISAIGVGLYLFLVTPAVRSFGWFNSSLIIRIAITLFTLIIILWRKIPIKWSKIPWKIAFGAAFVDVVGFILYNIAVQKYEVSYITIITSASSLVTVFLSYIFLKEKLTKPQLIGVLLVICGIILLQLR